MSNYSKIKAPPRTVERFYKHVKLHATDLLMLLSFNCGAKLGSAYWLVLNYWLMMGCRNFFNIRLPRLSVQA